MTPLILFLLALLSAYIGSVQTAFSALMRLPLRLNAERSERHGRPDGLGQYLDDPVRLFIPARLIQAMTVAVATMLVTLEVRPGVPAPLALAFAAMVVFVIGSGHVLPLLIVRRDPEWVLEMLLPSFNVIARALSVFTQPLLTLLNGGRREHVDDGAAPAGATLGAGADDTESRSEVEEHEERKLLQSVVEFGDTIVREVMTPRPDIVAVKSSATLGELRTIFTEQRYSRLPVYRENLDEILGFVFVKDLVTVADAATDKQVVEGLLRPAHVVPETKRVAELLKELQQQHVQSAIVHDEYGGTAGLVTIEDLLEEIVGEIRDEYDEELEAIVDEGDGSFVFAGTVGVDDVSECLEIDIERQGFETVGGYVLSRLGRVPRVGETLNIDDVHVEVLEGERRRVKRVRMRRRSAAASG